MTEEEKVVTGNEVDDMTPDYLDAIKNLKQNSVDRQKYDELRAENKKLLNAIVNGQEVEQTKVPERRDTNEIREELFNHEHSNLDYIKLSLELRENLIAEGKPDPFLPVGRQISPTREDEELAQKAAQVYQECIDFADGDSELFTNELMRRTKDIKIR
ncbi:MAG: hypothetical protein J6T10_08235 [Methanobrevibacter sp.]|nr:hypothetical protein [Methanobrevibacter sp.]